MRPVIYEHNDEGILCVYKNEKWLVSIKNWKPDNDITQRMNSLYLPLERQF